MASWKTIALIFLILLSIVAAIVGAYVYFTWWFSILVAISSVPILYGIFLRMAR